MFRRQREATTTTSVPQNSSTPRATITLITHRRQATRLGSGPPGREAAAADDVELQYSHDPDAAAQANLVRSAVSGKVAGIAVTLADPAVMAPAVRQRSPREFPLWQ